MGAGDVAEAESVGLGAGHLIFWVKAEELATTPYSVTISADDHESDTFTVSFEDTSD